MRFFALIITIIIDRIIILITHRLIARMRDRVRRKGTFFIVFRVGIWCRIRGSERCIHPKSARGGSGGTATAYGTIGLPYPIHVFFKDMAALAVHTRLDNGVILQDDDTIEKQFFQGTQNFSLSPRHLSLENLRKRVYLSGFRSSGQTSLRERAFEVGPPFQETQPVAAANPCGVEQAKQVAIYTPCCRAAHSESFVTCVILGVELEEYLFFATHFYLNLM